MKKSRIYLLSLVCFFVSMWLYFLFVPVIWQAGGVIYYLKPGTSKKVFISELAQLNIIKHPIFFSLYVYPYANSHLKTGEYLFPRGSNLFSIWRQVTNGTGLAYHPLTIIPGWSFAQLRTELMLAEGLHHLSASMSDKQIMAYLGDANVAPEGEFFPDTYYYTRGLSDLVILKHAYHRMQKKLIAMWQTRAANLPYKNMYDALIAASLIEKEAHLDSERPIIAGVLINRLRQDMLLQFDPTVIYGMGNRYDGKIHKADLLENTPYNTYVHKGLPPTPIAMPALPSINAALHPQQNEYYYFVAKGDGSHQFSKTLQEHNAAVAITVKSHSS